MPVNPTKEDLSQFLDAINNAYLSFDKDILQAENTLKQSSQEIFRINEELRNNAQRKTYEKEELSKLIESIVNSVKEIIFQTDVKGKWTYLNPAWEILTGYTVTESLGESFKRYT